MGLGKYFFKKVRQRDNYIESISSMESLRDIPMAFHGDVIKGRMSKEYENGIKINQENPIVLFIPHNDGMPTCPFVFYNKNNEQIITNQNDFTELQNLPHVLHQMTDVMVESYGKKIPIFSTENFGIKLGDKIINPYEGKGQLTFFKLAIDPKALAEKDKATTHCSNEFLDVFMGWNYGDVIRENSVLEEKLQGLTSRMLSDGVRRTEKRTGFEVSYRTPDTSINNFYSFELAKK